jgi:two-component system, NarL family, nitrate/nitrite response regulator NarL
VRSAVISVFVVSGVRLYREGLVEALERESGLAVAGAAADLAGALEHVRRGESDVVLLDVDTGYALDGLAALGAAARAPVVVLAVPELEAEVIAWAEAGVSGYLTRDQSLPELIDVVRRAVRGEASFSPVVGGALLRRVAALASERPRPASAARLTAREREILPLIELGLTNKEIARRLSIEVSTVKNHVHNILEKLQVQRRSEAAGRFHAATVGAE